MNRYSIFSGSESIEWISMGNISMATYLREIYTYMIYIYITKKMESYIISTGSMDHN